MIAVSREHLAHVFVQTKTTAFRPGFGAWLAENWAIYRAFEVEGQVVASTGRRHYSANTIVEYLRHQTLLRDASSEFKFNDRWTSSMARLFAMMNPAHAELFEFRERAGGVVKTPELGVPA